MIQALTGRAGTRDAPIRVLVADDNADFAANLAELVRLQRHEAHVVATVAEAFRALDAGGCDVAIVDHRLPDGTGTEFLVGARKRHPDLVTIIVTAYASLDSTAAALNEGAFAFVTKDSNPERLLDAIHRAAQTASLRSENRRLREIQGAIFAALPDQFLVVDAALRVQSVNRSHPLFCPDAATRTLPCPLFSMIAPLVQEKLDIRALLAHAEASPTGADATITVRDRESGNARIFAIGAIDLVRAPERLTLIRISELTERIELERRLSESEGLATLGRLTSVIAHEIRNPLTGIRALCQLLKRRFAADDPDLESVREMMSLTDRMNATLGDLLSYGRPRAVENASIPVSELVAEVARESRRWPACEARTLDVAIDPAYQPHVLGERSRLFSALSNLVENALHAVREGGHVLLRVAPGAVSGECCLTVEDDGPGIDPEIAGRLFEPFVTKKARGTGLGLSIVKKVIDAHGGHIEAGSSRALGGAAFTVTLPEIAAT